MLLFASIATRGAGAIPPDGVYTYKMVWDEWGDERLSVTCQVVIRSGSIKVLHDGKGQISGKKGEILAEGLILKHRTTGKWIIGQSAKDTLATEVGGCTGFPVIEFDRKIFHNC